MNAAAAALACTSLLLFPLALDDHDAPAPRADDGLVTLYAGDDLLSSFDLRKGLAGGRVEQGEIRLERAQLAFDVFARGQLSYGFVRDERVEVLDLGALRVPPQARALERAEEFPIALFHGLHFDGVRFAYLGPGGDVHPFDPADRVLGPFPPEGLRHIEPRLGHTYVARLRREGSRLPDELFKFQVVGLVPGQSLTLRWAPVPMLR